MRTVYGGIALMLGVLVAGGPAISAPQFSVLSERGGVQIQANGRGPVLVVERWDYQLSKGTTDLAFDFASAAVQLESVKVEADPATKGVQWLALHRSNAQNSLVWRLSSAAPATVPIRLSYLLDRLDVQPHYRLLINPSQTQAVLEGRLSIRNESGESFPQVKLHYANQPVYQGPLQQGETRALQWQRWPKLPLEKIHVWDAATQPWEPRREQAAQMPVELRLLNDIGKGLGVTLPAGKLRVLQDNDGALLFLGEARFTVRYPGQRLVLPVLRGRDLLVTQKKVHSTQVNPRPNNQRPRLIDLEEQLKTSIENRQDSPVKVELVQHLEGQWESIKSSHPFQDKGEGELRFPLTLAAGESVTVTFDYRLRNLRR